MDHPAGLLGPHLQVSVGGLHHHRLPQPQQQEEERGWRHPAEGNTPGSGKHLEYQQLTATMHGTVTVPDILQLSIMLDLRYM